MSIPSGYTASTPTKTSTTSTTHTYSTVEPRQTVFVGMMGDTHLEFHGSTMSNNSQLLTMYGPNVHAEWTVLGKGYTTAGVCTVTGVPTTNMLFEFNGDSDCYAFDGFDDTQGTRGVSLVCDPKPTGMPCK
ncbi:hypothetical protein TREMEDRAFT_62177 [Tremella mesenterica DSM 1558]|uniref:uncharacterized protein n=1 Tax=Tremella mesenterica (strain ATCC 24925 / CBS 8224 / DSM 1558 / NBRC 9311 / NRRL Y-6157 / RJB 2259-6 / UBC 559-6) TaxID=578456 RepID=UPI0003F48EAE|nr:uncharacterized protein TREMEDRAFT_62177 [Tremella mesenterica DSM 1558]EIW69313.1 hypothetical protein TREMEDRAFT_62177 [Tremella mesenterica DSM 1558]